MKIVTASRLSRKFRKFPIPNSNIQSMTKLQNPRHIVILSKAKDLWLSGCRFRVQQSEMFRFAQHDRLRMIYLLARLWSPPKDGFAAANLEFGRRNLCG
ncbi:MAG: hypothetical protein DMF24_07620 [Verrucomicrobia bacterium]|nr:MAG: hypothetical protein DME90_00100 [Verrucomicrobiota bacterium]PYL61323.1 MAG: hypothetical protein DMF24_07620 [Verrucomicrobiota bacterium]